MGRSRRNETKAPRGLLLEENLACLELYPSEYGIKASTYIWRLIPFILRVHGFRLKHLLACVSSYDVSLEAISVDSWVEM